ncbi:SRPBCC family protein [Marininema halotolerans]|uniref:PH domain-containing protein n=1 Tax=Marininema halotolerans TaxID=1155944 RepID=A0A1I6NYP2_9BACL|nr:SRPBCC family protein [Marininema halotolerans]SFS33082.1 hypothetical protein SAMN05444972_101241 [Marininema halotolerans]
MPTTLEFDIKATKEQLFTHLESEEHVKKWFETLEKLQIESVMHDGAIRKGSPLTMEVRSGKVSQTFQGEVIAYRKPELFGIRLQLTHIIVDLFIEFINKKNGVQLQCDCEIGIPEGANQVRARLRSWQVKHLLYTRLKRLKSIAEKEKVSV